MRSRWRWWFRQITHPPYRWLTVKYRNSHFWVVCRWAWLTKCLLRGHTWRKLTSMIWRDNGMVAKERVNLCMQCFKKVPREEES